MEELVELDYFARKVAFSRTYFELTAVRGEEGGWGPSATSGASKDGWKAYLIELHAPILFSADINGVLQGKDFVIHPPTQVSKGSAPEIPSSVSYVPDGLRDAASFIRIDYRSLSGMTYSIQSTDFPLFRGHLLRVDVVGGFKHAVRVVRRFLSCVRSYCFQWWLLGGQNPFDIGVRAESEISEDHQMKDVSIGGVPKYPHRAQMFMCGLEQVVSHEHWSYFSSLSRDMFLPDIPSSFFCDALEKFHLFEDESALMSISLALEAAEYEARAKAGVKAFNTPMENLNKNPKILNYGDKKILRKLFIDRGHVAHSKHSYNMYNNPEIINDYLLEATKILGAREMLRRNVNAKHIIVKLTRP